MQALGWALAYRDYVIRLPARGCAGRRVLKVMQAFSPAVQEGLALSVKVQSEHAPRSPNQELRHFPFQLHNVMFILYLLSHSNRKNGDDQ